MYYCSANLCSEQSTFNGTCNEVENEHVLSSIEESSTNLQEKQDITCNGDCIVEPSTTSSQTPMCQDMPIYSPCQLQTIESAENADKVNSTLNTSILPETTVVKFTERPNTSSNTTTIQEHDQHNLENNGVSPNGIASVKEETEQVDAEGNETVAPLHTKNVHITKNNQTVNSPNHCEPVTVEQGAGAKLHKVLPKPRQDKDTLLNLLKFIALSDTAAATSTEQNQGKTLVILCVI